MNNLEIIATNLTDVKQAELYGADRIELSPAMSEIGLTPSYGLIKAALKSVNIPINVMVRPHSQSFQYNENDLETMLLDIKMIKQLGANGIVIGPLTDQKTVDEHVLKILLDAAEGLEVTFHRAFDFARDQIEAFSCLAKYKQITTILTAGGNYYAPEKKAISKMNYLLKLAKFTHIKIMAGHGLRVDNFINYANQVTPNDFHFGSGVRINESFSYPLDKEKIKTVKEIINSTVTNQE